MKKDFLIGIIGGHLSTAEAVIQSLLTDLQCPKSKIVFLGIRNEFNKHSVEYETIEKYGLKFINVWAIKINRFFSFKNLLAAILFPLTIINCLVILIKSKVTLVVGFGGYISLPVCCAALILRKKIIIHEGTVKAGLANRLIAKFAWRSLIAFETSRPFFKKAAVVGFPLRKEIIEAKKIENKISVLLICGGHLGSKSINKAVLAIIKKLLPDFVVIHQTGKMDLNSILAFRQKLDQAFRARYLVKDYFSAADYAKYLINAKVIVSRSGINTAAETVFLNKNAIFIPLSFAQANEQLENARWAQKFCQVEILEQKALAPERLFQLIDFMDHQPIIDKKERIDQAELFRNSAATLAKIIYECAKTD